MQLVRSGSHFFQCVAVFACLAFPCQAQRQMPTPDLRGLPLRIVGVTVLPGSDSLLGRPTDMVVRPDGALCVSDMAFHRVTCLSDSGRVLFHSGRDGQGPGEFGLPYRLAAFPDNSIGVLDIGNQSLSLLDRDGRYVDRWTLPFFFHQVNGMLGTSRDRVAISGYAPSAGWSADSAVHLFRIDSTIHHVRSFGPLPAADNREVLNYWGTGRLTKTVDGRILLTQRLPYLLLQYDLSGRLLRRDRIPGTVSRSADLAFALRKDLTTSVVTSTSEMVIAPAWAVSIDRSLILAARTGGRSGEVTTVWWDCIDARTGTLLGSAQLPTEFRVLDIAGVSSSGHALLGIALLDDTPVLVRIDFRLEPDRE